MFIFYYELSDQTRRISLRVRVTLKYFAIAWLVDLCGHYVVGEGILYLAEEAGFVWFVLPCFPAECASARAGTHQANFFWTRGILEGW
jgi:hypothetical protein